MFRENQTQNISTNASYQLSTTAVTQGDDLGLFCSYRTSAPCNHRVDHEPLCILKCSGVKFEAMCLAAKAGPNWVTKRTMTSSTAANRQQNDRKRKKKKQTNKQGNQSPDLNAT